MNATLALDTTSIVIERLRLSARTYNALLRNGIATIDQLRAVPNFENLRGIRAKGAEEIRRALRAYFLSSHTRL